MTPKEFTQRLKEISVDGGVTFGRIRTLASAEAEHAAKAMQLLGFGALSDAMKCFFLETVELINVETRPKITKPVSEFYALLFPKMAHSFRVLCAAEGAALNGYPYEGYTLLRNIFDNLVLASAALQGFTDFYSIEGVVPGKPLDVGEVKALRKKTEFAVRRLMTGDESGLSASTREELAKLDMLFDWETHGARLSAAHAMTWMKGDAPLPVVPNYDERAFAMFMNRYCEIAWMFHRLIPTLQIPEAPLSDDWQQKWDVLDDSFRRTVLSLTEQLGKAVGVAMAEFVTLKFPFGGKSTFPFTVSP